MPDNVDMDGAGGNVDVDGDEMTRLLRQVVRGVPEDVDVDGAGRSDNAVDRPTR